MRKETSMKTSKKRLIWLYKDLAQRIGRQPTKKHWLEDANTPSDMPIRMNFGNWTNFIAQCGDKPTKIIPIGARKGKKNKKGVRRIKTIHGYIHIFKPEHPMAMKNGYVREHRMVLYDAGIMIKSDEEVHHKNGIKTDNRLKNLEVLTKQRHASVTWKGKPRGSWTDERRKAKSKQMEGNNNYRGSIHQNPELIKS